MVCKQKDTVAPRSNTSSDVIIENWFGRFSNNLIQLVNACFLAEKFGYDFVRFPRSDYFAGDTIIIAEKSSAKGVMKGRFFTFDDMAQHVDRRPSYEAMRRVAKTYIKRLLPSWTDLADIGGVRTVMHFRGGDVFSNRPQPRYVPAPLGFFQYYSDPLNEFGVINEDLKHPAFKKIASDANCRRLSTGDLFQDLSILGSCGRVVAGPGTFWFSAFLLGESIKEIVITVPPSVNGGFHDVWGLVGWPADVNVIKNYLHGYIEAGAWRNSFWQRRIISKYDFSGNVEVIRSGEK